MSAKKSGRRHWHLGRPALPLGRHRTHPGREKGGRGLHDAISGLFRAGLSRKSFFFRGGLTKIRRKITGLPSSGTIYRCRSGRHVEHHFGGGVAPRSSLSAAGRIDITPGYKVAPSVLAATRRPGWWASGPIDAAICASGYQTAWLSYRPRRRRC